MEITKSVSPSMDACWDTNWNEWSNVCKTAVNPFYWSGEYADIRRIVFSLRHFIHDYALDATRK